MILILNSTYPKTGGQVKERIKGAECGVASATVKWYAKIFMKKRFVK